MMASNHCGKFALGALFTAATGVGGFFLMGGFFGIAVAGCIAMIVGSAGAGDITRILKGKEDIRHSVLAGIAGTGMIMAAGGYLALSVEENIARNKGTEKNTPEIMHKNISYVSQGLSSPLSCFISSPVTSLRSQFKVGISEPKEFIISTQSPNLHFHND